MSEQSNKTEKPNVSDKVTAVGKTVKVKDPRKVELGKRLAKISREAKERKAKRLQRESMKKEFEKEEKEMTDYIDFKYFMGGVTVVGLLAGLYFSYKREKIESEKMESEKMESEKMESEKMEREKNKAMKYNVSEMNKNMRSRCFVDNL